MAFKIGQKVIHLRDGKEIEHHTITKMNKTGEEVWCDNKHKPEDCWYAVFLYPDTEECLNFLLKGKEMAERHNKEENDYMSETYKLNNKLRIAGEK